MVDNPNRMAMLQAVLIVAVDDEEQWMMTNVFIAIELEKEEMSIPRTPYHDDILIGSEYLKNVIYSGGTKCLDMFRLTPTTFLRLVASLRQRGLVKDNLYVSANEQVGILLQVIGHNKSNRDTTDHFQHSSETIS
uniref:DUF8040 domain-containing protein n=1 Tax=Nelumbo nucifera TaxID=4432 RepID=A0A822XP70_NELNU|nr:TPA_asm: hypothetical protein HUJ06_023560 [Nelumbo nucifera]